MSLPIDTGEIYLDSIRLCLTSTRLLPVARATSFIGCAQHLTWRRLQQRTCAPNAPYRMGKSLPDCRITRNNWAGRLAPEEQNAGNARDLCATLCTETESAWGWALPLPAISGHIQRHTRGRILECFCGERHDLLLLGCRVLPRAVLTLFPPSDRPHHVRYPEKEARVESFPHSPRFGPRRPIA